MFVEVPTHGRITHEEHGPISLPAGHYRVVRQREYIPGAFGWSRTEGSRG